MDPPDDAEVGATQQGSPKCSDSEKSDRVDAPGAVDAYGDKGITRAGRATDRSTSTALVRGKRRRLLSREEQSCPAGARSRARRPLSPVRREVAHHERTIGLEID
jgi:hypothetical protein